MTGIVDNRRRSEMMSGIEGRDTLPERTVRRIAHGMGLRFRRHRRDLPGRPGLAFPRRPLARPPGRPYAGDRHSRGAPRPPRSGARGLRGARRADPSNLIRVVPA